MSQTQGTQAPELTTGWALRRALQLAAAFACVAAVVLLPTTRADAVQPMDVTVTVSPGGSGTITSSPP